MKSGRPIAVAVNPNLKIQAGTMGAGGKITARSSHAGPPMPEGTELWEYGGKTFLARPGANRQRLSADRAIVPDDFRNRIKEIDAQKTAYEKQHQHLRTYKNQMLATLLLFTILLIFSATWSALLPGQAGYRSHPGAGPGNARDHRGKL